MSTREGGSRGLVNSRAHFALKQSFQADRVASAVGVFYGKRPGGLRYKSNHALLMRLANDVLVSRPTRLNCIRLFRGAREFYVLKCLLDDDTSFKKRKIDCKGYDLSRGLMMKFRQKCMRRNIDSLLLWQQSLLLHGLERHVFFECNGSSYPLVWRISNETGSI